MSVSGVYLFSWTATARKLSGESGYDIWNTLQVNGRSIASGVAESYDDVDDEQGSATVVIHVNRGDLVWTSSCCQGHDIFGDNSRKTTFF